MRKRRQSKSIDCQRQGLVHQGFQFRITENFYMKLFCTIVFSLGTVWHQAFSFAYLLPKVFDVLHYLLYCRMLYLWTMVQSLEQTMLKAVIHFIARTSNTQVCCLGSVSSSQCALWQIVFSWTICRQRELHVNLCRHGWNRRRFNIAERFEACDVCCNVHDKCAG